VKLIDELQADHALIEQVVGALRTYVARRAGGDADPADGARFLRFFRLFAGDYHHAREEQVLLAALVRELALPADRGPIAEIVRQHDALAATLSAAGALLLAPRWSPQERDDALRLTNQYCDDLLRHIDAETSVLFPESEARLRRCGATGLESRPPVDDELRARAAGEALVVRYPPTENGALMRGDGCVMCPAYGETCRGLEREWWTDAEWEDFEAGRGWD